MENKQIVSELIAKVLKLDINVVNNLGDDTSLKEQGLSSLKAMELIVLMETELDVELDDDDLNLDKNDTIKALCELYGKYKRLLKGE